MERVVAVTILVSGMVLFMALVRRLSPRLQRAVRRVVFAVYLLGNLYVTLLSRKPEPVAHLEMELFSAYRNSFELDYETALDELLEENLERWGINCAAGIAPNGDYSAALFTVPSGVYYWYWGKGQKGEICCLTADFFTYL